MLNIFMRNIMGHMEININSTQKAIVRYEDGVQFKIPSHMFPLKTGGNIIRLFTIENTEALQDTEIEAVYNSLTPRVGRCYDNTRSLLDALNAKGIVSTRIKSYVGWLFLGDTLPIHHSFVVVDDKHILDYSVLRHFEVLDNYTSLTEAEMRLEMSRNIADIEKNEPNSKRSTFGQAVSVVAYLASECSPEEGKRIRTNLIKAFPKHIAFADIQEKTALTKMQERLLNNQ